MKKSYLYIITLILCIATLTSVSAQQRQIFDVPNPIGPTPTPTTPTPATPTPSGPIKKGDFEDPGTNKVLKGLNAGCCNESGESPNFVFTFDPALSALRNHEASQLAAERNFNKWVSTQKHLLQKEIEKQLETSFSNFEDAQKTFFKAFEMPTVRTEAFSLKPEYNNKVKTKKAIRRRCLKNIKLLDLRAGEINSGNINNSKYKHLNLKINGEVLNDITSINQINNLRLQEVNEFTDNQWRLDQELKIQNLLNNELSNLSDINHDILNELSNIQIAHYNHQTNDFEKLDRMQQYLLANSHDYWPSPAIVPWHSVSSFGRRTYVEGYIWRKNPRELSIFHDEFWNRRILGRPRSANYWLARKKRARENALNEALNEITETDFLGASAIVGLGERNEDYIKERPNLEAEIENYFKVNDYSKTSHDCINYLLNQYLSNGHFALSKDYYSSASRPLFNSPSNPSLALGTSLNSLAVKDAFNYFNNVLAALFNDNVHRPEYKGQIIREMLTANGVIIPQGIDNTVLSNYFNFEPTESNKIQINHSGGHGDKTNLNAYLEDLKAFHNGVQDLLNNPPPLGSSAFGYIDYENRIAEVLQFTNDRDALEVAQLFQTNAARDAFLNLAHHNAIAHCGQNIIRDGFSEQLEFTKLDAEGLKIIAKEAAQVAAVKDIAEELDQNNSFWPQNSEEWGAFVDIMAPLITELIIGFIPGSDVLELFRSINNNDAVGASIAMAGLIVDVAGLSAIKGAVKGVKIFRKALIISRKLGRVLRAAGKAAKKGFKTTLDGAGRLVLEKGGRIIARGDDAVKTLIRVIEKLENLPNASKLLNKADPDLVRRLDNLTADQLNKLDDMYSSNKFKLPSDRPSVNGQKVLGDFTSTKTVGGRQVSVKYDKNGFPDFKNHSLGKDFTFKADDLIGNGTSTDFTKATNWLKNKFPDKNIVKDNTKVIIDGKSYTWHHHQDGKSLMPVLSDVHGAFRHSGGNAVINRGLKGLFSSPF
ncbi:HNH endonuclease [uncultured Algibacter sp.]|uniref:HNH endonuclease n=1 Tax=uncultured Algibacter sp. TaxID=298659 RepID=UPI003216A341